MFELGNNLGLPLFHIFLSFFQKIQNYPQITNFVFVLILIPLNPEIMAPIFKFSLSQLPKNPSDAACKKSKKMNKFKNVSKVCK